MNNNVDANQMDKSRIGAAFDKAADHYDDIALFQHQVCNRLFSFLQERLPPTRQPDMIFDGGCGTGYGSELLHRHWPESSVFGCDLSLEMLRHSRERNAEGVCGDLESLPFSENSFNVAWSSLALQWCLPNQAFAELCRVLAPGGMLVFSTLVAGTLHEIDFAFSGIDAYRRVLPFATEDDIGSALGKAGLTDIRLQTEEWVTWHTDIKSLLATIRGIGANQVGGERRKALMGKSAWKTAQARYESLRSKNGMLPVTYRLVFGSASKR